MVCNTSETYITEVVGTYVPNKISLWDMGGCQPFVVNTP